MADGWVGERGDERGRGSDYHTAPFRAGEATKSSHIEPRTTPQGQGGV